MLLADLLYSYYSSNCSSRAGFTPNNSEFFGDFGDNNGTYLTGSDFNSAGLTSCTVYNLADFWEFKNGGSGSILARPFVFSSLSKGFSCYFCLSWMLS
jgi:hypothetical protein